MLTFILKVMSIAMLSLTISEVYCLSVIAQNSSGTSTADSETGRRTREANAQEAQFKAETARFKAETAAIEARREAFKANLPSSNTVTAPTGALTVDEKLGNLSIETQILTYQALAGVLPSLVEDAKKRGINLSSSTIIIEAGDSQDVKTALDAYVLYQYQVRTIFNACVNAKVKLRDLEIPTEGNESGIPIAALLDAPIEVSKSIASLLALFRSDTTIAAVETAVNSNALVAELAATLSNEFKNITLYHPKLFTPKSGLPFIISDLDRLATCKRAIQDDAKLSSLSGIIDSFLGQLSATDASKPSSPPPILDIAKGARIAAILNLRNSYVLHVSTTAGGTNRVTRNLFTGTRLRHSGGVVFYYHLFDSTGSIRLSGVENFYTGFQKVPSGSSNQSTK